MIICSYLKVKSGNLIPPINAFPLILSMGPRKRKQKLLLLYALSNNHKPEFKRTRKWWVRPSLLKRNETGEFSSLVRDIQRKDETFFKTCMRMTPESFENILSILTPHLTKKTTNFREAISPAERLALTLRFLGHGDTKMMTKYLDSESEDNFLSLKAS